MLTVIALSFLIGIIMAAPVGPVGFTSMAQIFSGQRAVAFATMAGCAAAEAIFATLLVSSAWLADAYLPGVNAFFHHPPKWVAALLGLTLITAGMVMLLSQKMPKAGMLLSFTAAFKITLLSVHHLMNLTVLVTILGLLPHLQSPLSAGLFLVTYITGIVVCWGGLLQACWALRHHTTVKKLLPVVNRSIGLLTAAVGIGVLLEAFLLHR